MRSSLFCAYFSRFSSEVCYYNLSPQGDGNHTLYECYMEGTKDYNLSPQGDGNGIIHLDHGQDLDYNLSPQGDGNTLMHACEPFVRITTYPRKGTVTDCHKFSGRRCADYNLSPQGDGNEYQGCVRIAHHHYNLSPQGDGNNHSVMHSDSSLITTYPRKGTVT